MGQRNNVILFMPKEEDLTSVEVGIRHPDYTPASITLHKDIVEFLELMTFEERNDFLHELINGFFASLKNV